MGNSCVLEKNSKRYDGVYSYISKNDISYGIRYYENGRKRTKVLGKKSTGWDERKCAMERTRILNDIYLKNEDANTKRIRTGVYTLDDLFEEYRLEKEGVHKDFNRTELKYKRHVGRFFGNTDINEIDTDDIFKFRSDLLKKFSNATINYEIGILKTLFNLAIRKKIYTKPCPVMFDKQSTLKVNNERERYLTVEEVNKLLNAVKHDNEIYLFVLLSLSTGARLKTVQNIKYKDINLKEKTVMLEDFKTTSTYTGRFDNQIRDLLQNKGFEKNKNDFVIELTYRTIQNRLKKVMDKLFNEGLDTRDAKNRVVVHTLRHTFGSLLSIQGVSIYKIQKMMNHSSIEMTIRYSKLGKDNGQAEVEEMLSNCILGPGNIDDFE